jgi:hypothetical protein
VEGEPLQVYVCHCDFCQRRSGNVSIASASFPEDQVISITGDAQCYNGLEIDGVGAVGVPGGNNFRFCAVCGSSVYLDTRHIELRSVNDEGLVINWVRAF